MKQLFTFIFLIALFHNAPAQLNVQIRWGSESIALEKYYHLANDSLIFHELKFYLSDFQFEKETRKHLIVKPELIDLSDTNSLQLFPNFQVDDYQFVRFNFGLDSSYQVSESVEGALNPMNGMYWAWNSGYIQFKCTGTSSRLKTGDQTFEFHLGGYRVPNETKIAVHLPLNGNVLSLDLKSFFESTVDLKETPRIMIPSALSKKYCVTLSSLFYMQ